MKRTQQQRPVPWLTLLFTALLALTAAATAQAASLDSAKADGWIGEKPDGYLGLVRQDAPAEVKALVIDVNGKRKTRYEQIARQQGAPLGDVEKVGGATAIEKTPRGRYVMDASGRWRQK